MDLHDKLERLKQGGYDGEYVSHEYGGYSRNVRYFSVCEIRGGEITQRRMRRQCTDEGWQTIEESRTVCTTDSERISMMLLHPQWFKDE